MSYPNPDGSPRFEVITSVEQPTITFEAKARYVGIYEMGGEKWIDQLGYVKRTLFVTSTPVDVTSEASQQLFLAAEHVVDALNHMNLGIKAAEIADPINGVQRVFDYLWKLELGADEDCICNRVPPGR